MQRNQALKLMEIKEGKDQYFAIQFYTKSGEVKTINRARCCGLPYSMSENRMRGIQEVDALGNAVGHVIPVSIDNIRTFNGERIRL